MTKTAIKKLSLSDAPVATNLLISHSSNKDAENLPVMLHGFVPGQTIKILTKYPGQPLLIEVRSSYLAIDQEHARYILVEAEQNH